jgi:hypothetical protein
MTAFLDVAAAHLKGTLLRWEQCFTGMGVKWNYDIFAISSRSPLSFPIVVRKPHPCKHRECTHGEDRDQSTGLGDAEVPEDEINSLLVLCKLAGGLIHSQAP